MQNLVVGDTQIFGTGPEGVLQQPTLNGSAWDLTGGKAVLYLRRPTDRVVLGPFTGSIIGNIPQYVDSPSSLTVPGKWEIWWSLTDASGVHKTAGPVTFTVVAP